MYTAVIDARSTSSSSPSTSVEMTDLAIRRESPLSHVNPMLLLRNPDAGDGDSETKRGAMEAMEIGTAETAFPGKHAARRFPIRCTRARMVAAVSGCGAASVLCTACTAFAVVAGLIALIATIDLAATADGWRFPTQHLSIVDFDVNPLRFALSVVVANPAALTTVGVRAISATLVDDTGTTLATLGGIADARFAPAATSTWSSGDCRIALSERRARALVAALVDPARPGNRRSVRLQATATVWAVAPPFALTRSFEVDIDLCNVFRVSENSTSCTALVLPTNCTGLSAQLSSPLCPKAVSEGAGGGGSARGFSGGSSSGAEGGAPRELASELVALTFDTGGSVIEANATMRIERAAGPGFSLVAANVPRITFGVWEASSPEGAALDNGTTAEARPLVTVATVAGQRYDARTSPLLTLRFRVELESGALLKGLPRVARVGFIPAPVLDGVSTLDPDPAAGERGSGGGAVLNALLTAAGSALDLCIGKRDNIGAVFPRGVCDAMIPPVPPAAGVGAAYSAEELLGPTYSELWSRLHVRADSAAQQESERQRGGDSGSTKKARAASISHFEWRSSSSADSTALEFDIGWNDAARDKGGLGAVLADGIRGTLPRVAVQLHSAMPDGLAARSAPCAYAAAHRPGSIGVDIALEATMHGVGRYREPGGVRFVLNFALRNRSLAEEEWIARLLNGGVPADAFVAICGDGAVAQLARRVLPPGVLHGVQLPHAALREAWRGGIRGLSALKEASLLKGTSPTLIDFGFDLAYIPLSFVGAPKSLSLERAHASLTCDGVHVAALAAWVKPADPLGLTFNLGASCAIEVSGGSGSPSATPTRLAADRCISAVLHGERRALRLTLLYAGFALNVGMFSPDLLAGAESSGSNAARCTAGSGALLELKGVRNASCDASLVVRSLLPLSTVLRNLSATWRAASGATITALGAPPPGIALVHGEAAETAIALALFTNHSGGNSSGRCGAAALPYAALRLEGSALFGAAVMVLRLDESTPCQ